MLAAKYTILEEKMSNMAVPDWRQKFISLSMNVMPLIKGCVTECFFRIFARFLCSRNDSDSDFDSLNLDSVIDIGLGATIVAENSEWVPSVGSALDFFFLRQLRCVPLPLPTVGWLLLLGPAHMTEPRHWLRGGRQ